LIAVDQRRFRDFAWLGAISKTIFFTVYTAAYLGSRISFGIFLPALIDLLFAALFAEFIWQTSPDREIAKHAKYAKVAKLSREISRLSRIPRVSRSLYGRRRHALRSVLSFYRLSDIPREAYLRDHDLAGQVRQVGSHRSSPNSAAGSRRANIARSHG
jgi:hypothetical protein